MQRPFSLLLGFSVLPAMTPGDRSIYVSNAGNDISDGLTPITPKATIAAGKALQRDGTGDRLHLNRGDTWTEAYGSFSVSGASATRRIVVTAYGSGARPRLQTGTSSAFDIPSGQTRSNIAIIGIEAEAHTAVGTTNALAGVMVAATATDILIEDCYFTMFETGINIPGGSVRKTRIAVRRCILYRNFRTSGSDGHGLYAANVDGLLMEENLFHQNGYNPAVGGSVAFTMRHNVYIQGNCTDIESRGNLNAEASSHGLQMRSGGIVYDDCYLNCPNALLFGTTDGVLLAPVTVDASYFTILGTGTINGSGGNSALNLEAVSSGSVRNFVISKPSGTLGGAPLTLGGSVGLGSMQNMEVEDGILYGWGGSIQINGNGTQLANSALRRLQVDSPHAGDFLVVYGSLAGAQAVAHEDIRFNRSAGGTSWWYVTGGSPATCSLAQWQAQVTDSGITTGARSPAYTAPTRTIGDYAATLGLTASLDGFLAAARGQRQGNWNDALMAHAVNDYVFDGFIHPRPPAAASGGRSARINRAKARHRVRKFQ